MTRPEVRAALIEAQAQAIADAMTDEQADKVRTLLAPHIGRRPLSSEPQPLTDEQASRIRAVMVPHLRAEAPTRNLRTSEEIRQTGAEAMADAPPLTEGQVARLRVLLHGTEGGPATPTK